MSCPRKGLALGLLACVSALIFGCQGKPPSPVSRSNANPDQEALRALDCYEPMYKLDEQGRVTHLRLIWLHLSGPALAEVGKLTELQGLDLAWCTMTDDGLAQLKDLHKLRSLGLGGTMVTDGGLVHLEKLPGLKWVWLPKKTVSEEGAEKLKEMRPDLNVYRQ